MTTSRSAVVATALYSIMAIPVHAGHAAAIPLTGNWAGDRVALTITAHGARITEDCADGSIDSALLPDRHGRFRADGKFAVHQPGPQRADEDAPIAATTHFDGVVTGNTLVLTITGPGRAPRKVTLARDARLKAVRCL